MITEASSIASVIRVICPGMGRRLVIGLLATLMPFVSWAQEKPAPIHWAFSSFFGTGWYRVDDNRSVFVFRIPPRQTVRRASFENGQRKIGVEIHYPLTLGLHNLDFDDLPGNIDIDNFGTASFTPGLELEIPVTERWSLRPFAKFGYGQEFETSESAWIYEVGIKSRYQLPSKSIDWAFLSNIHFAGYNPSKGDTDDVASVLLGLEIRQPIRAQLFGNETDLHWHTTFTHLNRELNFINVDGTFDSFDDIVEIGLAVSFRDRPFKFWFYKPTRLGLGIQFSPDGDYAALTFTTRSWFTK